MMKMNSTKISMGGFSLIELMIAVAIIGIIAGIAYPQYRDYINNSYRAQAQADLKICALALERFYSNGFTYTGGGAQCATWSPSDAAEANKRYDITVTVDAGGQDFTLRATPITGCPCIELEADGTVTEV